MLHPQLVDLLASQYGLESAAVEAQLKTSGSRAAYRLRTSLGRLVLKITDPGRPVEIVRSDTGVLDDLAKHGFPAPRLVKTRLGQSFLPFENRSVYLYTYLEGEPPLAAPEFYPKLGRLLARLHSLPVTPETRRSAHRPENLVEETRDMLRRVPVEPEQQALKAEALGMLDAFPSFDGLPEGLIHTDPYFTNLLRQPSGELALVDWEDAGVSYPLIDVGYIGHLVTFLPNDRKNWQVQGDGPVTVRLDYLDLFLDAYQSVRPLEAREKDLFGAAVRLNFLEYLCDWQTGRIIPENMARLKILEQYRPPWA